MALGINITNGMVEIKDITSLNQATLALGKADETTLVVFDVDYVLTQPEDPALQMKTIKTYKETWKGILGKLSPLESDILSTLVGIKGPKMQITQKKGKY